MPDTGSESENPVIPSPTPKAHGPMSNRDWWPDQLEPAGAPPALAAANPMGGDFDYAKEFASLDVDALQARPRRR